MAKKPVELGSKYLEIVIDENGQTSVEAHGFNGVGCREATKGIEIALGGVRDRKDKRGPDAKQTIKGR